MAGGAVVKHLLCMEPQLITRCLSPSLQDLEAEAIAIMRETVAEFRKPVMLYSVGKDSTVMLHIALKAFPPDAPFPLQRTVVRASMSFSRRLQRIWRR
jgi:Phosphoadenosine phosphosulfate reductase family